ncbi:MAG: hypothetical protein Q7T82_02470 [Armatimonadota bacterium]|nr:hypothetical protein [Armatimonadota bacterium]
MVLRRIVLIVGALVALVGLSQVAAVSWWLRVMPSILSAQGLRIVGVVALAIGIVLTLAAVRRLVGLRPFVLILGVLMTLGGVALLINPAGMRDSVYGFFLNRPHGSQVTMTWVAGLIRAAIGIAIIYAATRAGAHIGPRHARA